MRWALSNESVDSTLLTDDKLRRVLGYMLDEKEFLGPFGIRSLSLHHRDQPYVLSLDGTVHRVDYEPAESSSGLFGGNSNWRGPIWLPVNVLLIRALLNLYSLYGPAFTVECPIGSGVHMDLLEVARELLERLTRVLVCEVHGDA